MQNLTDFQLLSIYSKTQQDLPLSDILFFFGIIALFIISAWFVISFIYGIISSRRELRIISALVEREEQRLVLAQDRHRWRAHRDAMRFKVIDEILRETDDLSLKSTAQDEIHCESALQKQVERVIQAYDHTHFSLRDLQNGVRSGHYNSVLALMVAYQMGCIDASCKTQEINAHTTF